MWVPRPFEMSTEEAQRAVAHNPFVLLTTADDHGVPTATHLPIIWDPDGEDLGSIRGHIAASNPHATLLSRPRTSLVVAADPHGYVSPRWYESHPAPPTWNYLAVHLTGPGYVVHDRSWIRDHLHEMTDVFDPTSAGRSAVQPTKLAQRYQSAIVGVELWVERVEAAAKLSQNRSPVDQTSVIGELMQGSAEDQRLGRAMQDYLRWE